MSGCYSRLKTRSRVVALDARVGSPRVPLAVPSPPNIVVAEDSLLLEILDLAGVRESLMRNSRHVAQCELSHPNMPKPLNRLRRLQKNYKYRIQLREFHSYEDVRGHEAPFSRSRYSSGAFRPNGDLDCRRRFLGCDCHRRQRNKQ